MLFGIDGWICFVGGAEWTKCGLFGGSCVEEESGNVHWTCRLKYAGTSTGQLGCSVGIERTVRAHMSVSLLGSPYKSGSLLLALQLATSSEPETDRETFILARKVHDVAVVVAILIHDVCGLPLAWYLPLCRVSSCSGAG